MPEQYWGQPNEPLYGPKPEIDLQQAWNSFSAAARGAQNIAPGQYYDPNSVPNPNDISNWVFASEEPWSY